MMECNKVHTIKYSFEVFALYINICCYLSLLFHYIYFITLVTQYFVDCKLHILKLYFIEKLYIEKKDLNSAHLKKDEYWIQWQVI